MKRATVRIGSNTPAAAAARDPNEPLDVYGLLKTMLDNWQDVFDDAFDRKTKHKARGFVSMRSSAQRDVAHLDLPLHRRRGAELPRCHAPALDAAESAASVMAEAEEPYDAQRGSGIRAGARAASPRRRRRAAIGFASAAGARRRRKALKPWIEVALPHQDVIANRIKEAEFAADLFAVDAGHADGRLCHADAVLPASPT